MHKSKAIELLGGSIAAAAEAIGVSYQAVNQWPDELPERIADRVLAAQARKHLPPELIGNEPDPARLPTPIAPSTPATGKGDGEHANAEIEALYVVAVEAGLVTDRRHTVRRKADQPKAQSHANDSGHPQ